MVIVEMGEMGEMAATVMVGIKRLSRSDDKNLFKTWHT